VLGVLMGGALTQAFGWEAVFFVNMPLAAVAIGLAFRLIPLDHARDETPLRPARRVQRRPGHHPARVSLVEGPNLGWASPVIVASLAASLLFLGALTVI
jgi:predicted MFS family arabinose efflux permease